MYATIWARVCLCVSLPTLSLFLYCFCLSSLLQEAQFCSPKEHRTNKRRKIKIRKERYRFRVIVFVLFAKSFKPIQAKDATRKFYCFWEFVWQKNQQQQINCYDKRTSVLNIWNIWLCSSWIIYLLRLCRFDETTISDAINTNQK